MIRDLLLPAAAALLLGPNTAAAQERPSEQDLFGEPQPQQAVPVPGPRRAPAPAPQQGAAPRLPEEEIFGETPQAQSPTSLEPTLRLQEDPLKIGGQIYLRLQGQWQQDVPPANWSLALPALVDGYMDVRPNDRVRGFLLARMLYDLSRSTQSQTTLNAPPGSAGTAGGSGSTSLFLAGQNPQLFIDQLWVNFDIERTAFVTAGKQHVKWGTGQIWNPTDFLHPVPRDPLAPFDARPGQTMVKLHLPWERRGWNFYGMAVFDETQPAGRLGNVGAGARAEVVFGTAEFGIDGLVQRSKDARLGLDFSAGIWDFDVYGEAALREGSDVALFQPDGALGPLAIGVPYQPQGLRPAVVGGLRWSYKYNDEDSLTLGFEYFYNSNGYDNPSLYPWLLLQQQQTGQVYFTPFYLGRHYAAVYLLLPKPGSWNDTTFRLSSIGNLSDHTYLTRLDCSVLILTYLTLEAYLGAHYGTRGGELRLALDVPQMTVNGATVAPFSFAPPVLDFGVALRVSL